MDFKIEEIIQHAPHAFKKVKKKQTKTVKPEQNSAVKSFLPGIILAALLEKLQCFSRM